MKKCIKVFLISFVATFPFVGLIRTAHLTQTIDRNSTKVATTHNLTPRVKERQVSEEPAAASSSHHHDMPTGG